MRVTSLFKLSALCLLAVVALFAIAAENQKRPLAHYTHLTNILIPGGLTSFDISWVDPANARFYLADSGAASATPPVPPRIDVIDTEHDQYLTSINLPSAPHGVLAIPRDHELWAGLTDSTVAVINTDTNMTSQFPSTGGQKRADELAYDPVHHVILIANDQDSPPFVSFISQQTKTVLERLNYDGISAPQATGGIEQPVWDGPAGKFYLSIPVTTTNANGEVDEIDPVGMSVTRVFPTTCHPAGLALIPGQHLITSCGDVIDVATGNVLTSIRGVSGDEIWFNSGDERVYFGGGTDRISVNVVDTGTNLPLTTLTVGQILAPPAVSHTTHSVAADSDNNHIYVPVSGIGVEVWTDRAPSTARIWAAAGNHSK